MSVLSRLSLANRRLVALLTLLVVALGGHAALSLKQQLIPDLSIPAVTVVAPYQGAAPDVVEEQVTLPIEDAVAGLDGLEGMTSTSKHGSASVTMSFGFDTDIDAAAGEVEQAISKITATLPEGVRPQVLTGGTADQPTMVLAATWDADQHDLATRLEQQVVPELEGVDGVNEVSVSGTRGRQVTVTPRAAALAQAGLTTESIADALGSSSSASSAGSITSGGKDLSVAVGGPINSVTQLRDLWVSPSAAAAGTGTSRPARQPVRLGDVATVRLTDTPVTSITRTDGAPSLGPSITMDHDGSSASISSDVRDLLPSLERSLGHGARLTVVSDNGPPVRESVHGLLVEGVLGLLMALVVIVLFLHSGRSTLVTAVSIPLSLLVALIALWIRGYSLNILTLGGLTIAVGRVVDDSIVVLENIKRHLGYGEERGRAIIAAVQEVASPVISSTLTTVAVFLPIAFLSGLIGQLFSPFGVTVSVAMLASLLVSLTVVPTLAYWFLKAPADAVGTSPEEYRARAEAKERDGLLPRLYLPVITWSVQHRRTVLSTAMALLVGAVALVPALKTSFLGDSGPDILSIHQSLPAGSDLATTDAAARKVEKALAGVSGVTSYQVVIGSAGGFRGATTGADTATYTVNLGDDTDPDAVQDTVRKRLAGLEGVGKVTVAGLGSLGGDIDVSVHADDEATLKAATDLVQRAVAGVAQVTDVRSDLSESAPQIHVVADGTAAARYGVTDTTISAALRQAVQGTVVAQATVDGERRDVVVRAATAPGGLAGVKALPIATANGTVRLDQVATITQVAGPVQRTRVDGERTATVTATPAGDDTGGASSAVHEALRKLSLPAGATYETGGVSSDQSDAFSQLIIVIVIAVALVFLILVAVFRSFRQTLILLVSIPFAFVGAIVLLLVTGTSLGIAALIGILMLIGIVVTNAVVLMDLINVYREHGMTVSRAVVEGGLRRLRPILMTALATIFALVPMALGITDSGGFISQPLAVVVIGGLLTSTLLTLVLIPILYTMVETRRERRRQRATEARPATGDAQLAPVPSGARSGGGDGAEG